TPATTAICSSLSSLLCPLHRGLHSFPTRRSSDLGASATQKPCCRMWAFSPTVYGRFPLPCGQPRIVTGRELIGPPCGCRWLQVRSEEHTSELQSRENLVCRLLLEKKNKRDHKI